MPGYKGPKPVPAEHDNPVFAGLKAECGLRDPHWTA